MIILSLNVRGLGEDHKQSWVKRICVDHKVQFMGLQENFINKDDKFLIKVIWKNFSFDYILKKCDGKSGGIIVVWDTSMFSMHSSKVGDEFVAVKGLWLPLNIKRLIIIIYTPQCIRLKKALWDTLRQIISDSDYLTVTLRDFNKVRNDMERLGLIFHRRGALNFNDFINSSGLIELPMGGMCFTRMKNIEEKNKQLFRGIEVGKDKVDVSHLQFTDDVLIMENGLPIGANILRSANWYPLLERFQNHLSSWKAKALSFGGRLTLTKSVLGSLGVYYFSTFKASKMVISKLERVRRKFFWGSASDSNKIAWIAWEKVISPLNQGGLSIRSLRVTYRGYSFTLYHKSASKMSRLNRFLISEKLLRSCPNFSSITLDQYLYDHRPILPRELSLDYAPNPFHFFHNWFELEGFDSFVVDTWRSLNIFDPNALRKLAKKLKLLKGHIRVWVKGKKDNTLKIKKDLKNKLFDIDSSIDKRKASSTILEERLDILNNIISLEKMKSIELVQKAKVKWLIEGDENFKFYHGIINKHQTNLDIRGIIVDGEWIEDPNAVKNEFLSHF
nr:RNA-directed DNA polymerase, eukaryota [Tanacetum cinerariifolium]